jgi:hypothetical protein
MILPLHGGGVPDVLRRAEPVREARRTRKGG